MASEMDAATEASVLIPEIWSPIVLDARYQAAKILKRVLSKDADVKNAGDTVHIPIRPSITIGDITQTTGEIDNQALTYTEAQLVVDKWRGGKITIVDMASWQSIVDMAKDLAPDFGKALAADIDSYLGSLYSSVTTNSLGSSTDDYSGDMVLAGLQKLIDLSIPVDNPNDISLVLHTSKWSVLKNIDKFSFANYTGYSMGGQLKYEAPAPYGVPHFFTTAIKSSGSAYQNMLFHREAFAAAVQKRISLKELAPTGFNKVYQAGALFGVKTIRETYACLLKTK